MGLSASQARLLNLTNRMHQIEYNASRIEAMKLQMANESRRVYEDYLEALDQAKIQKKTLTTNGAVTFVDIHSYEDDFVMAGFKIVLHSPKLENNVETTTTGVNPAYTQWQNRKPTIEEYTSVDPVTGETVVDNDGYNSALNDWTAEGVSIPPTVDSTTTVVEHSVVCNNTQDLINGINTIFDMDVTADEFIKRFEEFLTNLINSGYATIIERAKDPSKYGDQLDDDGFPKLGYPAFTDLETSVATNTGLQEVTDEVKLRKAEAKYEADMKRIDMKDRRYDSDLAALDNERNAIKQEMETLKTVARDNVDRTFKIFS